MRRVLITGGARRIGADLARALVVDGWHVVVHYNSSSQDAAAFEGTVRAAGGRCDVVQADLSERCEVLRLVPECARLFGPLDALINNASSFRYDSLQTMDPATWDAHLGPNLEAPIFLAQSFAQLCGGRHGCVVNMLDHKVTAPNPDFFSYTVAKMAMAGATRLLAQALARTQVRVCGIAPGITLLSGKQTQSGFKRAWTAPPLGRSSTPEELADACRYVLDTPSLNGQILVLDGGDSLLERSRDVAFESERRR